MQWLDSLVERFCGKKEENKLYTENGLPMNDELVQLKVLLSKYNKTVISGAQVRESFKLVDRLRRGQIAICIYNGIEKVLYDTDDNYSAIDEDDPYYVKENSKYTSEYLIDYENNITLILDIVEGEEIVTC